MTHAQQEARKRARETFVHYFSLLAERTGRPLERDNFIEIEGAVDDLIAAATPDGATQHEEAVKKLQEERFRENLLREEERHSEEWQKAKANPDPRD